MGTTPIYGFPYPDPSDLVANYPALGQQLAEDIEDVLPTLGGMTLMVPTSIANTGGSAASSDGTTTFTTVTNIAMNGVFTADYENYFVTYTWTQNTTADSTLIRLRVAGADNTTANYNEFRDYAATTGNRYNGETAWRNSVIGGTGDADTNFAEMKIFKPQKTAPTLISSICNYAAAGAFPLLIDMVGSHNTSTSFDGLSFTPNAGTLTGTIRVYGFRGA